MNRQNAKKLAETVTNEQLQEMFERAKNTITDWTESSNVNKSMTKGAAWNILAKDFNVKKNYSFLVKKNMIWEFGDFLSDELKPLKKQKKERSVPFHQEPIFRND